MSMGLAVKLNAFGMQGNIKVFTFEINNEIAENTKMSVWYKEAKERKRSDEKNETEWVSPTL